MSLLLSFYGLLGWDSIIFVPLSKRWHILCLVVIQGVFFYWSPPPMLTSFFPLCWTLFFFNWCPPKLYKSNFHYARTLCFLTGAPLNWISFFSSLYSLFLTGAPLKLTSFFSHYVLTGRPLNWISFNPFMFGLCLWFLFNWSKLCWDCLLNFF